MTRAAAKRTPRRGKRASRAAEVAEFDRELVADTFAPPPPAQRERWERAQRKPGRPRKGRGAQVVSVTVERDLLERSDALASKMGLSRAALVSRGLRAMLAAEGHLE
jgi:hypothetical protein